MEETNTVWNEARALAVVSSWRGTKHVDRIAIKGVGVDCINFVCAVVAESGICDPFTLPYYDPAWGIGASNNIMERVVLQCLHARVISDQEPMRFGDIVIFRVGRQSNHIGVIMNGEIWHCQLDRFVEPMPLTIEVQQKFQSIIRIEAHGFKRHPETLTSEDF